MLKTCNLNPFMSDTNKQLNDLLSLVQDRRVTPPPLVRSIQFFVDGTQYAKGRYAVRKDPVISYADIILYLKMSNFH